MYPRPGGHQADYAMYPGPLGLVYQLYSRSWILESSSRRTRPSRPGCRAVEAAQGVERSHRRQRPTPHPLARDRSTRCRLGPDAPSGRWRSAPPSPPLERASHLRSDGAPAVLAAATGRDACRVCACQLEVLGAAHRGSRRIAPVATRHALQKERPNYIMTSQTRHVARTRHINQPF